MKCRESGTCSHERLVADGKEEEKMAFRHTLAGKEKTKQSHKPNLKRKPIYTTVFIWTLETRLPELERQPGKREEEVQQDGAGVNAEAVGGRSQAVSEYAERCVSPPT